MDQNSLDSSQAILQRPRNWKLWLNIIQKFATAYNTWEFIDPSRVEKAALLKSEEPTYQDINQEAAGLAALTPEEFCRLEFLYSSYRTKCQTYQDQQKVMASIEQHIVKTAGSYYSSVEDHHDIATELTILKARVEPTDWAHEQDVLERYHDILNGPSRTRIED
jgi:hypothetical protein